MEYPRVKHLPLHCVTSEQWLLHYQEVPKLWDLFCTARVCSEPAWSACFWQICTICYQMQIILKLTRRKYPGKNKRAPWEQELLEPAAYLVFSLSADMLCPWESGLLSETFDCQSLGKKVWMVCVKHLFLQPGHNWGQISPLIPFMCVTQGYALPGSAVGAAPGMPQGIFGLLYLAGFSPRFPLLQIRTCSQEDCFHTSRTSSTPMSITLMSCVSWPCPTWLSNQEIVSPLQG